MTDRNTDRLSLLLTFKAILQEGTLVAAARSRNLTQSAISKHLAKLRDWLRDPLFVRTAEGMQPTRKALSMVETVETILQGTDRLVCHAPFDPAALRGNAVIATTSEIRKRLLKELLPRLSREAPDLRLSLISLETDYSHQRLAAGQVQLVLSVNWHAPDTLMQRKLYTDRFVCVMRKSYSEEMGALTPQNYAASRHVLVAPLGLPRSQIDDTLERDGLSRHIRLSVPDFHDIKPCLIEHGDIITLPTHVAHDLLVDDALITRTPPIVTPEIDYFMFWHRSFGQDQTNLWLREILSELFQSEPWYLPSS